MTETPLDLVPFALPGAPAGEIRFEEPRDIVQVEAEFEGPCPPDLRLSYLRKTWPEVRLEEAAQGDPFRLGWVPQDDWFNTQWHKAAIVTETIGSGRVRITFEGLRAEFPDVRGYDVRFRRTLGVRIETSNIPALHAVHVFSASKTARSTLRVHVEDSARDCKPPFSVTGYNAVVERVVSVRPPGGARSRYPHFLLEIRHMIPAHAFCGDDGLLTFELEGDAFTISLCQLEQEGPIWYAERGFFIANNNDPIDLETYRARHVESRTLAESVRQRDEQSLSGAMYGQPRPHAVSYSIGCPHARQRYWIEPNGDIVLHKGNVTRVQGRDTERFRNRRDGRFYFGLENWFIFARFPDPEPVLAYNVHAKRNGITVEQKCFAVPLNASIFESAWEGDDPMAALVRLRFRNAAGEVRQVRFPVQYSQDAGRAGSGRGVRYGPEGTLVPRFPLDALAIEGDAVYSRSDGGMILRALLATDMETEAADTALTLRATLEAGGFCDAVLKIPYVALEGDQEIETLRRISFDESYDAAAAYWRRFASRGAQVFTPEPRLDALHLMHPVHVAITDFAMPGEKRLINTSVGTSTYGNFSNEACMVVHDLDQRGLHEEARRRLEVWLKYQGTAPQPGNFTDYDGMFFGAGGFESGAYNQHHGWVLWRLCEHFFLTRDSEWFRGIADAVVRGADWVFRQRRNTMRTLPHSRGWEHGFLPAGSLEDVTDFYYWLSTNALTWRGVEWAARALAAVRHPEAERVRREADAYRDDLRRGFETARRHAPLVRLRDGRWVPTYPSRLYRRGREAGWIRETLEGAVYLLLSGLYDAKGREAQWILDDYQDNRYSKPPYGYAIEDFESTWFDRAGFSMQPNLLAGLLPYLERDEPELYIWMFFNAWAACYREEINAMIEHPTPVLGYSNHAHFKTSDQANAMMWLRYMFVYCCGTELWLGRAIPRAWFGRRHPFGAKDVVTPFGKAGIRYEPAPDENRVEAAVSLDTASDPSRILVRFRHPERKPFRAVYVNGISHDCATPDSGDVDITGLGGNVLISVSY